MQSLHLNTGTGNKPVRGRSAPDHYALLPLCGSTWQSLFSSATWHHRTVHRQPSIVTVRNTVSYPGTGIALLELPVHSTALCPRGSMRLRVTAPSRDLIRWSPLLAASLACIGQS